MVLAVVAGRNAVKATIVTPRRRASANPQRRAAGDPDLILTPTTTAPCHTDSAQVSSAPERSLVAGTRVVIVVSSRLTPPARRQTS